MQILAQLHEYHQPDSWIKPVFNPIEPWKQLFQNRINPFYNPDASETLMFQLVFLQLDQQNSVCLSSYHPEKSLAFSDSF